MIGFFIKPKCTTLYVKIVYYLRYFGDFVNIPGFFSIFKNFI